MVVEEEEEEQEVLNLIPLESKTEMREAINKHVFMYL